MSEDVVPDGHQVVITGALYQPTVTVGRSGAIVADLGTSSDDAVAELARISAEVDALLAEKKPVVVATGALTALFAPNDPPVMQVEALVLWVVDADRYACTPELCGQLVDQLRKHPTIAQTVFVRGEYNDRAKAAIGAIQTADIGLRRLTSFGNPPRYPTLIEVIRPDRIIVTLGGDAIPRQSFTGLPGGELPMLARAPVLNRLLFDAFDADRTALYTELKGRGWPLIGFAHPGGAVRVATWPGDITAMPVFADRAMAGKAMKEIGLSDPPIVAAAPSVLFKGASEKQLAVAIGAFTDDGKAKYIVLSPDELRQLV